MDTLIIYQPESLVIIEDGEPVDATATMDQPGIMTGRTPGSSTVPRVIRLGSYSLVFDGRTWKRVPNT